VNTTDRVEYLYDAMGTKLAKKPNGDAASCEYYMGDVVMVRAYPIMAWNIEYLLTPEGRVDFGSGSPIYEYHLKDHLGNTRVAYIAGTSGAADAVQEADYYPFGMKMASALYENNTNKYLYNGKELQDNTLGNINLDWYDYGARFYDPSLGRFHCLDAFAEEFNSWSPYHYANNNPILNIDINGDSTYRFDNEGKYLGLFDTDVDGIRGSIGSYSTYTDQDGNEQTQFNTEANFNFNDPAVDKEQLSLMKVGQQGIQIVTEENINDIMSQSGVDSKGVIGRYYFAATQSASDRDAGSGNNMDFGIKYLGGKSGGKENDTYGGFFIFGNQPKAYNAMDAGNWLWGQGMKRLSFDYSTAQFSSQANEKFHDPKGDQRAIRKGFHYTVKSNKTSTFKLKNDQF